MFTAQRIKSLKVDQKQEIMEGRGFGIRVQPSGAKTWIYRYRYAGKLKRMSLGTYPDVSLADARQLYLVAQAKHRDGRDPQLAADTVSELADVFVQRHSKLNKKSWKYDVDILDRDVIPRIGRMKIGKVRRPDIISILDAITDRGSPSMANRTLAVIKKMFNYAAERGLIDASVVTAIKLPNKEQSRDRVLADAELLALMDGDINGSRDVMRLMALTGQRKGEILQMRYQDLERDLWTIPGEFVKNKKKHYVPLVPEVWPIIDRQASRNEYVFQIKPGAPSLYCRNNKLGYTPHDIRRTVASRLAEAKVQRVVISKLLNHSDNSVTAVYDRYEYLDEIREALEAWTQHIVRL